MAGHNPRVDLWLFPFLNVYVMGGYGYGHTTVKIAEPVPFETTELPLNE